MSLADYGAFHGPIPPNRNGSAGTTRNGGNPVGRSVSLRLPGRDENSISTGQHFHYVEAEIETHRHPSDPVSRQQEPFDRPFSPSSPLST